MVRSSPLSSRTFECSPAAAISRTCSTTLMLPPAGRRGRDGGTGRDPKRGTGHGAAAARRHSKMAPPRGPRAPLPAGDQGTARAARQAYEGQPAPRAARAEDPSRQRERAWGESGVRAPLWAPALPWGCFGTKYTLPVPPQIPSPPLVLLRIRWWLLH